WSDDGNMPILYLSPRLCGERSRERWTLMASELLGRRGVQSPLNLPRDHGLKRTYPTARRRVVWPSLQPPAKYQDGPQVFRTLSDRAGVEPGVVGAAARGVFDGCDGGLDHHRPVRLPRDETCVGDVFRRASLRGAVNPAGIRRL